MNPPYDDDDDDDSATTWGRRDHQDYESVNLLEDDDNDNDNDNGRKKEKAILQQAAQGKTSTTDTTTTTTMESPHPDDHPQCHNSSSSSPKKKKKKMVVVPSPATQTLTKMSQNMCELRDDNDNDNDNDKNTNRTEEISTQAILDLAHSTMVLPPCQKKKDKERSINSHWATTTTTTTTTTNKDTTNHNGNEAASFSSPSLATTTATATATATTANTSRPTKDFSSSAAAATAADDDDDSSSEAPDPWNQENPHGNDKEDDREEEEEEDDEDEDEDEERDGNNHNHHNELSEYELLRLQRIERNQARLKQLGLLEDTIPKKKKKKKKKQENNKQRRSSVSQPPLEPLRQLPKRAVRNMIVFPHTTTTTTTTKPQSKVDSSRPSLVETTRDKSTNPTSSVSNPAGRVVQGVSSSSSSSSSNSNNKKDFPYCLRCHPSQGSSQNPARNYHHAWCPHNKFYDKSGAKALTKRIRQGIQLGCKACDTEYRTGKVLPGSHKTQHNTSCLQNLKRKRQEEPKEEKKPKRNKRTSTTRPNKGKPKPKETEKVAPLSLLPPSSSSSEDDEDDNISVHPPKKKKQRVSNLSSSAKARPLSKKRTGTSKKPLKRKVITPQQPSEPPTSTSTKQRNTNANITNNNTLKPNWVDTTEDPWGKPGYVIGDVMLYGPPRGLFHIEILVPSKRYVIDPFALALSYRKSHMTPQEGLTNLTLRRDPFAIQPWGFQMCWHEFGHACLVQSIEPMSPAAAAVSFCLISLVNSIASSSDRVSLFLYSQTFLGVPDSENVSTAGLKNNDMILMVNGKSVGGMTEYAVELELDTSGPLLHLVVSRYRHADGVAREFAKAEAQMLGMLDKAAGDGRLIGWLEVGNADNVPLESDCEQVGISNESLATPEARSNENDIKSAAYHGSYAADEATLTPDNEEALEAEDKVGNADNVPLESDCEQVGTSNESSATPEARSNENGIKSAAHHGLYAADEEKATLTPGNEEALEAEDGIFDDISSLVRQRELILERSRRRGNEESNFSSGSESSVGSVPVDSVCNGGASSGEDWEKDENAWLGCVCGEIHKKSDNMFWIQCESCNSWHDVSERCVGFGLKEAKDLKDWTCRACPEPETTDPRERIIDSPNSFGQNGPGRAVLSNRRDLDLPGNFTRDSRAREQKKLFARPSNTTKANISGSVKVTGGGETNDSYELESKSRRTDKKSGSGKREDRTDRKRELEQRTTDEGFLRPRVQPTKHSNGSFSRPPGPAPANMEWDAWRCLWVTKGHLQKRQASSPNQGQQCHSPKGPEGAHCSPSTCSQSYRPTRSRKGDSTRDVKPEDETPKANVTFFQKGDLVQVTPHSWPGKNCEGGIGHVQNSYVDDDGDRFYCVKFVLGWTDKQVEAEYVHAHSFFG